MNDEENLETQAAQEEPDESSDEVLEQDELMEEGEPEEADTQEEQKPEEPAVDEEKEALKARLKREQDAKNGVNADKTLLANTLKKLMDDYGIDYEDAAKHAGINPNDLKARVENVGTSDNPVEAFTKAFDDLYITKGGKAVLDDVYGTDTQAYVAAFAKYGLNDPELQEQALSMEPAKALNFVVKHGKELMEELGSGDVTVRKLAKELAATKAELAKLKTVRGEAEEVVQQRKTKLPLDGAAGVGPVSKPADGVEARFYS